MSLPQNRNKFRVDVGKGTPNRQSVFRSRAKEVPLDTTALREGEAILSRFQQ